MHGLALYSGEEAALQVLTWPEATAEMSKAGADGASELLHFVEKHFPNDPPLPAIVEYSYGDHIFHNGDLLWPNGAKPPEAYWGPNGLALGLVLQNQCEVQARGHRLPRDNRTARAPEALLGPGEWLGLFEFFDRLEGIHPLSSPNWSISAGARAIFSLVARMGTDDLAKARRREFDVTTQIGKHTSCFQFLEPMIKDRATAPSWKVRILFLPVSLLAKFLEAIAVPNGDREELELFRFLSRKAWRNFRRSGRDADHEIRDYVLGAADHARRENDRARADHAPYPSFEDLDQLIAAAAMGSFLYKAQSGQAVVYGPSQQNDSAGPFENLSEFLGRCGVPAVVMRPFYATSGDIGFYRLQDIHPAHFGEKFEARLNHIATALKVLLTMPHEWTGREHIAALYGAARFRVPASAGGAKGTGETKTLRPRLQAGGNALVPDPEPFFTDAFQKPLTPPPPRAAFFRAVVRVQF